MNKQIKLRPIAKDDLEWARKLRNKNREHFFDNSLISKEQQEKWYKTLAYPFFVVEYRRKMVGTIAIRGSLGQFEIHNVLIDEKYRKKGLLRQAISILEKKYGTPLYVDVQVKNKSAINAYKELGFYPFAYRMKKK